MRALAIHFRCRKIDKLLMSYIDLCETLSLPVVGAMYSFGELRVT